MAFASVNGITISYRLAGPEKGSRLIFANALGTDMRIWDEVVAALSPRYRILTYDKRGHGLSDAPEGPYSLDDHVDDLLGLADHVGFTRFGMVGVSVGGLVAQRLALRAPGRIAALVLCDTAAKVGDDALWNERIATVRAKGIAAISSSILESWLPQGYRERRPADYAGWRNLLERTPLEGYIGTCATVRDADLTEAVSGIVMPVLVVAGAEDGSTPPDLVRATAERLPKARFEIIAGAGHIPAIDQPERLVALIASHFEDVGHV